MAAAEILNAYLDDDERTIVVRDRAPDGRTVRRRVAAEHVTWHRAADVGPEAMRQLRDLDGVRSVRVEGAWLRVGWTNKHARRDGLRGMRANDVDSFEGDVDPVTLWLVESKAKIAKPRRCYLDLEGDSRVPLAQKEEMRILSWAVVDHETGEEILGVLAADDDEAEAELLSELARVLARYDQIVVWEGDWKGGEFDSVVLPARWRRRGLELDERRWLWLNQLAVWKRMNMHSAESGAEKESFKLEDIAHEQIGEGKEKPPAFVAERWPSKVAKGLGAMTWDLWEAGGEFRELLGRYNVRDAQLLRKLELKKGYVALFQAVCFVCGLVPHTRSLLPTIQMDAFMFRLGREHGHRFATKVYQEDLADQEAAHDKFKGAYVLQPKTLDPVWRAERGMTTGILRNVHVADFAGMYPSLMMTFNLSAEVIVGRAGDPSELEPNTCLSPGTGLVTRTDAQGMVTLALREFIRMRKEYADKAASLPPGTPEWQDAMAISTAYKVVANSFYGAGGSPHSRFYNRDVSESTTQNGVYFLKLATTEGERRGMEAVYSDTDSVAVIGPSLHAFGRFVDWLNAKRFPAEVKRHGCVENHVKIAFEKSFSRIVFVSAKRYCNTPDAPIWMADGGFKPIGDVKVGDLVMGWEDGSWGKGRRQTGSKTVRRPRLDGKGTKRKLCAARVAAVIRRGPVPVVKVTFESGRTVRCTADHRWRAHGRSGTYSDYVPAKGGRALVHVVDVPRTLSPEEQREADWLGGIWDGEGSLASDNRGQIVITQSATKNPEVCARIEEAFATLGFDYTRRRSGTCDNFAIRGSLQERVEFLAWCRPAKAARLARSLFKSRHGAPDRVVSVEPDGESEVVALTTTTGNYVAWGFASKNCASHLHYKWSTTCNRCTTAKGDPGSVDVRTLTCRDCGHVYNAIPRFLGKPEIKGLEFKRGDKGKLARELQGRVIDMLVGGVRVKDAAGKAVPINADLGIETPTDDLDAYRAAIERMQAHVLGDALPIDDVKWSKGLSRSLREYGKDATEPHVRVARVLVDRGQRVAKGMRVEYVVIDGARSPQLVIPAEDYDGDFDRFHLWEHVYQPTQRLLEAAFPAERWERWAEVRPPKSRGGKKGKVLEGQLGFNLAARDPAPGALDRSSAELAVATYARAPLTIRIPEAAAKAGAVERVKDVLTARPGARLVNVVIVTDAGAESVVSWALASPGERFKAEVDAAVAGEPEAR